MEDAELCFPSRQHGKWTLSSQKGPKSLQTTLVSENSLELLLSSVSLILNAHAQREELQTCHSQVQLWPEHLFCRQLFITSTCLCQLPKGVSQTGVFLLTFQALLLIKVRSNFFKNLNSSQRVCFKIMGSFQTYPESNTSFPTALLMNKMKQICFTGLQKITA